MAPRGRSTIPRRSRRSAAPARAGARRGTLTPARKLPTTPPGTVLATLLRTLLATAPPTLLATLLPTVLAAPAAAQAAAAREEVVHNKAASKLVKLLEIPAHKSDSVRDLLAMGEDAVPDLARALSDPRIEIVRTVAHVLRTLGSAAKAATHRLEVIANGKDAERARTARWALAKIKPRGILLVAASRGQALELSSEGKEGKALKQANSLFDVEQLPNGNYLCSVFTRHLVQEVTPEGKVVWKTTAAKSPMDADRLPNGNTLIADLRSGLIELDPKGKVVWKYKTRSAYRAERLPNGHTLIAEFGGNLVVEIDAKRGIVWQYSVRQPMDAHRLPNGNTLIALYGGRLREVDPKRKVVWEIKTAAVYAVARMPNGDHVTAGNDGVRRYDRKGKLKWHAKVGMAGSVELY